MVLASAQLRARPERKDGGHPALCNAPPQWLRMRHQSHQSHQRLDLRYDDPDTLLNNAADAKVRKYREAYAAPDRFLAFLPAIMSTSGRIHGEFLRLLHILSHRQAVNFFELFGEEPTDNAFTFRRAAYFFHNRATIGLACAQATAMRTHVAPHTIRRLRASRAPGASRRLGRVPGRCGSRAPAHHLGVSTSWRGVPARDPLN